MGLLGKGNRFPKMLQTEGFTPEWVLSFLEQKNADWRKALVITHATYTRLFTSMNSLMISLATCISTSTPTCHSY